MAERTLMAVGAHADDIELNCGGTLVKYRDLGYQIVYVQSTNNMSGGWTTLTPDGKRVSRLPPFDEIMTQRKREAAQAAAFFGTEPIHLDHPQRHYTAADGSVVELRYGNPAPACVPPDTPTILTACEHAPSIRRLADLILERRPEAILTHGGAMANLEHVATCLLVTKAYWKAVEDGYDGMLLHWHDLDIHLFALAYNRWDTFIEVTRQWERKLQAVGLHACQIPTPERLDFPACGAACGCERAETYTIVNHGRLPRRHSEFQFEILQNQR